MFDGDVVMAAVEALSSGIAIAAGIKPCPTRLNAKARTKAIARRG